MTTKTPKEELRFILKKFLKKHTGCEVQYNGWTCGTCFYPLMDSMKIPKPLQHSFWKIVLAVRGDYDDMDWAKAEKEDLLKAIAHMNKQLQTKRKTKKNSSA